MMFREWLALWMQDLRFALRGVRARPGFSLTILLTLALGVGANAAIFSVVDAVLLRPLPFAQPDRLVHLWERFESKVDTRSEASYPDYLDWRARNRVFADLGGYQGTIYLYGGTQPSMVAGAKTTANFFDVLGVHALVGRTFAAGEDAVGAPRVVLLSYGFWQRQFGGDERVVGRTVNLDGAPATIVGVLPQAFEFARQANAELWTPIDRGAPARAARGNHWLNIVARLRPGVTVAQASQDMTRIMRDLAREYPETSAGRDAQVVALQQEFVGSVRPILLLLYGAVVVVLLIACVNVANLLLIRGADRQREIAVRAALGAGQPRLVRQFVTESVMLALVGGVLGLGVAKVAIEALAGILRGQQLRGMSSLAVGLDARVVAYALAVALFAGFIFGLLPALRITRPASYDTLRSAACGMIGGASALRDALVIGEIALTIVLLAGATLFGRSVLRLLAIDPGFRAQHVIAATVVFPSTAYRDGRSQAEVFRRLTDRVRETPGVADVGLVSKLPLDYGNSLSFDILGQPAPEPGKEPAASYRMADDGYFRTLAIPVVEGRAFDATDDAKSAWHVIVNRALAKAYLGSVDPVGQRFFAFGDTVTVIGVVGDVPIGGIDEKIPPTLYVPFAKASQTAMGIVIRSELPNAAAARILENAAAAVDRNAAVTRIAAMTDVIARSPSVFLRRLPLYLVGTFALTALVLAIVGIYGVVSYSVAQRTRELGIRIALGAQPRDMLGLVLRHGGRMAVTGAAAGVVAAIASGRFVSAMLYGVRPTDPTTYALVVAVLAAVTCLATLLPARRATRVDPAVALREE